MFVAVALQVVSILVLSVAAWLVFGSGHAISLLAGGLAATVPNALFAFRLSLNKGRSPESYPVVFFLGEFIKIGLTVALLALMVRWADHWQWPAVMLGLIVALKAPLFAIWLLGDKTPASELDGQLARSESR
ncbi:MAG: ATP synthase subunit I [Burkholderiaceae bacterium]